MGTEFKIHLPRPHAKQIPFITESYKRKIIRGGRRGGKTKGAGIFAVKKFLAGKRILYAPPTTDQLQRFWVTVTRALHEPTEKKILYKNETEHIIEVPGTENRIRAKTAWNADTLRGDYADVLILDEWQLMNEGAWEYVGAPMLLDNDGDAIFIYTPPSLHSRSISKADDPQHAAKMYKKALEDTSGRWKAYHFTSHDNPHISKAALSEITNDMTALAYRMEIMAEDIDQAPGALWTRKTIDDYRVLKAPHDLARIVVGVDPSATSTGDEAGIIVAGTDGENVYILEDDSLQGSPLTWATAAVTAYHKFMADMVIAESNQGGEMVSQVISQVDSTVLVTLVHASRGKAEWLNNPILTTMGWKTFLTIKNGDMVFDHIGKPTPITLLPIHEAECAAVVFSDGTSNVYALEHEWKVLPTKQVRTFTNAMNADKDWARWNSAGKGNYPRALTEEMKAEAKRLRSEGLSWAKVATIIGSTIGSVRSAIHWFGKTNTCAKFVEKTTAEMMKDMTEGCGYLIPNSPPIEMEGTSYIDPYLLGLWLGDGCCGGAVLAQKTPEDTEKIKIELKDRGFDVVCRHGILYIKNMRWAFAGRDRKHLYEDEWMVRTDERIDLIRGLIDSDGTKKSNISISLTQSGYRIKSVLEPACDAMRSLGWGVNKPHHKITYREPAETITIHPLIVDCAGLLRKHINYIPHSSRYRTIVSIESVGMLPVRCISVNTDDHLYLSGRGLIATHNSTRAEPVAAQYERGKVHHVGTFPALEDELALWVPGDKSPNRLDACFIAGTLIETDKGSIPIEAIKVGDEILTRKGFKKVLNAGFTGMRKTVDLILSCGIILTGTKNHPIYTQERGFVELCNLKKSDTLLILPTTSSFITELHILAERDKNISIQNFDGQKNIINSIAKFGKTITGKSLVDMMSTILMIILSTILQKISNVFLKKNMRVNTRRIIERKDKNILRGFAHLPLFGMAAKKVVSGILFMVKKVGKIGKGLNWYVQNVVKNISTLVIIRLIGFVPAYACQGLMNEHTDIGKSENALFVGKNLASKKAKIKKLVPAHVVLSQEIFTSKPVYNLEVEETHEYFANGILVHNCVWALTSLMLGEGQQSAVVDTTYVKDPRDWPGQQQINIPGDTPLDQAKRTNEEHMNYIEDTRG